MAETPTATHVAWDALVELAKGALPGVQVVDGPHEVFEPEKDFLVVGYSDGNDPAVTVSYDEPDVGLRRVEEGDITCAIVSYSGEVAMKPRRDRCAELLGTLADALNASPGLGGAVDAAWLGVEASWIPTQASDGAACTVLFTVHYRAYL